MVRKETFKDVGCFNEEYFMYAEDIELCYKIRKAGYRIYYIATEEIFHLSGASSAQRNDRYFGAVLQRESNYRFMYINYGSIPALQYRLAVCFGSLIRLGVWLGAFPIYLISGSYRGTISIGSLYKYIALFLWSVRLKRVKVR